MSLNCLLLALFLCAGAVSGEAYKSSGVPCSVNIKALFPCAGAVSDDMWSGVPWPVNIKDPILKEIAEFAVSEFNKWSSRTPSVALVNS
ncbi:hypothetical protein M0R45_018151 [Rubus argutus]|uniref:Uncharacterized protein n=1 Tax=Rubus argutus TaxID=59490 RepID=A0AAW1X3C4_RUBAR